ncbi:hypothetical protein BT63DRAFT_425644 [Microthyrium microscopicum]|uniref:C2H2-type domain-containing protein n=1 Tax=Microthyrium microscopicum TaxID=703497 RepID=A0A6A6U839_9PEZI|nr:hypothetical protein BT63DRAFT_425644 [Microthyrium microscopicum]
MERSSQLTELSEAVRSLSRDRLVNCLLQVITENQKAEKTVSHLIMTEESYSSDETRSAASDYDPDAEEGMTEEEKDGEDVEQDLDDDDDISVDSCGVPTERYNRSWKRKRADSWASHQQKRGKRFERCCNCKEEFDTIDNHRNSCLRHHGIKQVDNENGFWDDHEAGFGEPETLEDEIDYAEGFIWTCCNRLSPNEGCLVSKHKA